jgi:hypothetical protein
MHRVGEFYLRGAYFKTVADIHPPLHPFMALTNARPIDQDQLSQSMSSATSPQQYQHPATAGPLTMPPHLFGDLESLALSPRLPQHNGGRMPSLDQSWPGNGNSPAPGLSSTWNGEMMAQAVSGLDLDSTPGKHDPFPFPTSEPSSPGTPGELESLESRLYGAFCTLHS